MKYKLQHITDKKVHTMPKRMPDNYRYTITILSTVPTELLYILLLTRDRSVMPEHKCIFDYSTRKYVFYFANVEDRLMFMLKYVL